MLTLGWLPRQVCMKPGKPLTFAEIYLNRAENAPVNKVLVFGLTGNPVGCLVCFHLFVVSTIRHLTGWANPHLLRVQARLQQLIKIYPGWPEFHCATIRWEVNDGLGNAGFVAESTSHQMSNRILSMKSAPCSYVSSACNLDCKVPKSCMSFQPTISSQQWTPSLHIYIVSSSHEQLNPVRSHASNRSCTLRALRMVTSCPFSAARHPFQPVMAANMTLLLCITSFG